MSRSDRVFFAVWAVLLVPSSPRAQTLEVAQVISRPLDRMLRLPGELQAYQQLAIAARISGFVEEVLVDRGSRVRKGDLLLTLSAPEMTAQLAEAQAKAQVIASQKIEAEARTEALEITLTRLRAAAVTPGAIAANEIAQTEKAAEAARAARRALEDSTRAAEAAVAAIRDLRDYLRITAPFDGTITERNVHPGALVGPAAGGAGALLRLEQLSRLRLIVAVPEANVAGITVGESVPFTVPAYPGEPYHGTVARVSGSMDPKTRTMPVELDVPNPRGLLAPGMYPEVTWRIRRPGPSLLVPPSSIVTTTERTFVIRVRAGKAEWVNVMRGYPAGDLVEVFGALNPGDEILRRGTDEVRENSPVQISRPGPKP